MNPAEVEAKAVVDTEEARALKGENMRLFRAMRWAGIDREVPLVVETLRAFADGRIRIEDKLVVDADGNGIAGYDLTNEIEAIVGKQKV